MARLGMKAEVEVVHSLGLHFLAKHYVVRSLVVSSLGRLIMNDTPTHACSTSSAPPREANSPPSPNAVDACGLTLGLWTLHFQPIDSNR